jgi:hypothetical protein
MIVQYKRYTRRIGAPCSALGLLGEPVQDLVYTSSSHDCHMIVQYKRYTKGMGAPAQPLACLVSQSKTWSISHVHMTVT